MTTFTIIFASACVLWLWLTILACLFLAGAADDLAVELRRKENRRRHSLGKWLVRSRQLRRVR
jgi:type II secretory pathway component PulK